MNAHSPPNFLEFIGTESQQIMTALVNCREEFDAFSHLDHLYRAPLAHREVSERNMILHQLLIFTHYHLYFSVSCFMRCHLSEAFSSVRVAIDAALVAHTIISDRSSQEAYFNRSKPYDKLVRHYRNMIRDGKSRSKLVPFLIDRHDFCSQYASHADLSVFVHRASIVRDMLFVEYFQFPRDPSEMSQIMYSLIRDFTVVLDIFSPYLVDEIKIVTNDWRDALHQLGAMLENRIKLIDTGRNDEK